MTQSKILGRPISGDREWYSEDTHVEQYDAESFLAAIDKVFFICPDIIAIQWQQYTPYFNDGEACTFRMWTEAPFYVSELRPEGPVSCESRYGEDPLLDSEGNEILGEWKSYSDFAPDNSSYGRHPDGSWGLILPEGVSVSAEYEAVLEFGKTLGGGHWRNVLLTNFGDPANVIATRDAFYTETFDHD